MKRIAVLGSTGSIGRNTLEVIGHFRDKFSLVAVTANSDFENLSRQINKFSPKVAAIADVKKFNQLKTLVKKTTRLYAGQEAINEIASSSASDVVVLAISGSAALFPLLSAIRKGKTILLANKEALVTAGEIITREARKYKARLIPVDSEESAIWQCLKDNDTRELNRIYLTASGGPLYDLARSELRRVTVGDVLHHPRWNMGRKITVDSATLMNKGLEVMETKWLFGVDISKIKVIIHRQAIIHSMVEFVDGVILAQLSVADMKIPIQHALSYPERLKGSSGFVDFTNITKLTFEEPDLKKFPCLGLALEAAQKGGTLPAVLNAANEEAVSAFLNRVIGFIDIPKLIKAVVRKHKLQSDPSIGEILSADNWARQKTRAFLLNV